MARELCTYSVLLYSSKHLVLLFVELPQRLRHGLLQHRWTGARVGGCRAAMVWQRRWRR